MAEYKKPTAQEREKGIATMVFCGILLIGIAYFGYQGKLANDAEQAEYDAKAKRFHEAVDDADRKIEIARKKFGGR